MFDLRIVRRGRRWKRQMVDVAGKIINGKRGASRPVARYQTYQHKKIAKSANTDAKMKDRPFHLSYAEGGSAVPLRCWVH
jgi:hypothetical protein